MKKVLIVLFVVIAVLCALNEEPKKKTYTKEEFQEAIAEAEYRAYKRGYDEGEYYAKGEIEQAIHDAEGNWGSMISEYEDAAYEAGYERGYEEGYDDCLEEHGLYNKNENVYISTKKKD